MSCRLQMKHKLYIKMKVNGVATAIPETIKVSDNDLSKSLTGHKSRSETKREVINNKYLAEELLDMKYNSFVNFVHGYKDLGYTRTKILKKYIEDMI